MVNSSLVDVKNSSVHIHLGDINKKLTERSSLPAEISEDNETLSLTHEKKNRCSLIFQRHSSNLRFLVNTEVNAIGSTTSDLI